MGGTFLPAIDPLVRESLRPPNGRTQTLRGLQHHPTVFHAALLSGRRRSSTGSTWWRRPRRTCGRAASWPGRSSTRTLIISYYHYHYHLLLSSSLSFIVFIIIIYHCYYNYQAGFAGEVPARRAGRQGRGTSPNIQHLHTNGSLVAAETQTRGSCFPSERNKQRIILWLCRCERTTYRRLCRSQRAGLS